MRELPLSVRLPPTVHCVFSKCKTAFIYMPQSHALLLCICMENVLERGWSSQLLCTALMSEDDCEACLLIITWRGLL